MNGMYGIERGLSNPFGVFDISMIKYLRCCAPQAMMYYRFAVKSLNQ